MKKLFNEDKMYTFIKGYAMGLNKIKNNCQGEE